MIERGVRLVVVDSIAALARADFPAAQLPERQQALGAPAYARPWPLLCTWIHRCMRPTCYVALPSRLLNSLEQRV